ncbi:hypothetical protein LEN26_001793 [Aphanomyces euteiches]|nr:hypothetical protein AeMF1_020108 [Aphanomyces euteiches]KAH9160585.1 hypothetical protein LEN26_001793 [Aphanomyces euteiches]
MDDAWDIATDLPFLIARDEELKAELASVFDLLAGEEDATDNTDSTDSTSTESTDESDGKSSPPPAASASRPAKRKPKVSNAPPGARNPYQFRQKQEILLLQSQVETLKQQLEEARQSSVKKDNMPKWERAARMELQAKLRALADNEQMKADIEQQNSFIAEMERFFRKKPRLTMETDIESEEWCAYKLAAKASLRFTAIHAIADRQYRRMETAFINADLVDVIGNLLRLRPVRLPNNKLLIELVNHVTLAAPYRNVAKSVWQTHRTPYVSETSQTTVEVLDPYTVYEQCTETKYKTTCHSNTISKYYQEDKRDVILWRTVLEDELSPHMLKGAVDDQWGWLELTPLPNRNHCRLTLLMQIMADTSESAPPQLKVDATVDSITATLQMMSCSVVPKHALPHSAPFGTVQRDEITDGLPPALLTFMERGRRMENLLRSAVDRAIADFNNFKQR